MREALSEIWIENKWYPAVMAAKFVLIFALLFGGVCLRGFPYGIVFLYLIFNFNMVLLTVPEIDFFLPRSGEEWYRIKWKKSLFVSLFYAGITAGGYILNVAFVERYHFDFIHNSIIWIIFSLTFVLMLENRLHLERTRYEEDLEVPEGSPRNRLAAGIILEGVSIFMTYMLIVLFCMVDFAELDGLLFLQQKRFRILEFLIYIVLMGRGLYMIDKSLGKLKSFCLRR